MKEDMLPSAAMSHRIENPLSEVASKLINNESCYERWKRWKAGVRKEASNRHSGLQFSFESVPCMSCQWMPWMIMSIQSSGRSVYQESRYPSFNLMRLIQTSKAGELKVRSIFIKCLTVNWQRVCWGLMSQYWLWPCAFWRIAPTIDSAKILIFWQNQ